MSGTGDTGARADTGFLDGEGIGHASGLSSVAERYGVSLEAVRHLVQALERGHGTMAQFDHPELGGMGQWFAGGMTMVGRMFDDGLRARVAALCAELAASLPAEGFSEGPPGDRGRSGGAWWPADLGSPAATGAQDGLRYAYFPQTRRLAVESAAGVVLYDTGEHRISGVSQADGRLAFTGPAGPIALDRLRRIEAEIAAPREPDPAESPVGRLSGQGGAPSAPQPGGAGPQDVLSLIERLADLHARGALTDREFQDKKAELLARL